MLTLYVVIVVAVAVVVDGISLKKNVINIICPSFFHVTRT
jgi:hypothetical protein